MSSVQFCGFSAPVSVLGGFAVEVRTDGSGCRAFDGDAFDGHTECGGEVFAEAGLLREHIAAGGKDERVAVAEEQHRNSTNNAIPAP